MIKMLAFTILTSLGIATPAGAPAIAHRIHRQWPDIRAAVGFPLFWFLVHAVLLRWGGHR
jgi:hypothetical protein